MSDDYKFNLKEEETDDHRSEVDAVNADAGVGESRIIGLIKSNAPSISVLEIGFSVIEVVGLGWFHRLLLVFVPNYRVQELPP